MNVCNASYHVDIAGIYDQSNDARDMTVTITNVVKVGIKIGRSLVPG